MQKLKPTVQNYHWGKANTDNIVKAIYAKNKGDLAVLKEQKAWAEIWMGTHPKGETILLDSGEKLSSHMGKPLPFLFKVLSIGKCLSLQIHPDKALGEILHLQNSEVYKNNMPKPEVAISLGRLDAWYGFCEIEEIKKRIVKYPILQSYIKKNDKLSDLFNNNKQAHFTKLFIKLLLDEEKQAIQEILESIALSSKSVDELSHFDKVISSLLVQYPGDIGVLFVFTMNLVVLNKDEAVAIKALQPHAYINGDIIECMPSSDNVIRLGLTPKYRDVDNFLNFVKFDAVKPEILKPEVFKRGNEVVSLYKYHADFDEYFECYMISLSDKQGKEDQVLFPKHSILINLGSSLKVNGKTLENKEICINEEDRFVFEDFDSDMLLYCATSKQL